MTFSHYLGGYGWFGVHGYNPDECSPQQEQPVTISNLLPSDESSLGAAREQWLVALSSFRQVSLRFLVQSKGKCLYWEQNSIFRYFRTKCFAEFLALQTGGCSFYHLLLLVVVWPTNPTLKIKCEIDMSKWCCASTILAACRYL